MESLIDMQEELYISAGPCLIVGGGEIDMEWARGFAASIPSAMTIACDSGIMFFYENGKQCPDLFVSDDDSADPEMIEYYADKEQTLKHALPVQKDMTDSEEALKIALQAGCDPIYMIGMTGGRLDHTLGNIQMLHKAADAGVHAYLIDAHSRALLVSAAEDAAYEGGAGIGQGAGRVIRLHKDKAYGQYFSLFALGGPVSALTITGAAYPLKNATLTGADSIGVSNQFAEDEVVISFEKGYLLIVESRD